MNIPLWVSETANSFWGLAGEVELFPRNLTRPIALGLPVSIVRLSRLSVLQVDAWLQQQGIQCDLQSTDRSLRACVISQFGVGIIFVDGTDPDDEVRFSISHEISHFLLDYWLPRRKAINYFGQTILEAVDGIRPLSVTERTDRILANIEIGLNFHLFDRNEQNLAHNDDTVLSETRADRLAYELLAPHAVVVEHSSQLGLRASAEVTSLLMQSYGMPPSQAQRYSRYIIEERSSSAFLQRLGFSS